MRLYYDMLIPYMPDSIKDENGNLIANKEKAAGRQAMSALAKFQNSDNIFALYQAVAEIATYANIDLINTIIDISDNKIIEGDPSELIDEAAKMLFQSIKEDYEFDVITFISNVLTAAHMILQRPVMKETIAAPEE